MVYLALGSNLGDRERYLESARSGIATLPGTKIVAQSAIEETAPIGPPGQSAYLNQMVAIDTEMDPHALLRELQKIEHDNGRVRGERWSSRTLDIDIILYGDKRIVHDDLKIPHPELPNRYFWQKELQELGVDIKEYIS